MAALLNRARMTTATTGTGTVTLGSASTGFATFAEAGATNATAYSYCLEDGNDFEIGVGTYTSSGTTFSRDTVTLSKISGTAGTSKINLSGSATIFITARVADIADPGSANTFLATQTITPAANTNALAVSGYSLTGSNAQNLLNLTGTWNTTGAPNAIFVNITDTASSASSMLMRLQQNGADRFYIRKDGAMEVSSAALFSTSGGTQSPIILANAGGPIGVQVASNLGYGWMSTTTGSFGAPENAFLRDAAHAIGLRGGTNAQTFRLYRTFTDASNHQRLAQFWNTTTAVIHNEGAGTGADGSIAFNDAALATSATRGFIMIPSCAGVPSGVPADIPTGQVPIAYDTTNNRIYAYNGSWRQVAVT